MAGYSGTPLVKKLGIREGFVIRLINEPAYYPELTGLLPQQLHTGTGKADLHFIHFFATAEKELDRLDTLKNEIRKDGMIWVSWEKKKTKLPGALNENKIREKALATGLVDVKVCAVDEEWSALKLVWRKENR